MPPSPVTVVYLAYGPPRVVDCAVFSALTFLQSAEELSMSPGLVIYTDRPADFQRYGVTAELVPVDALQARHGGLAYPHRSKILALHHAATHYGGSIFYLDGDTYFAKPPMDHFALLSATRSVMHRQELVMSADNPLMCKPEDEMPGDNDQNLFETIHSNAFESPALRAAQTESEIPLWNAGTLGIDASNTSLIPDVLAVSDELYSVYRYHMCEQMAWALVLSQVGSIVPADDVVYHYWHGREELTHRVVSFLRENRRVAPYELRARAYALRPRVSDSWRPPPMVRARVAARSLRQAARIRRLAQPQPVGKEQPGEGERRDGAMSERLRVARSEVDALRREYENGGLSARTAGAEETVPP